MDPIAHTMTGAALARGGLRRASPLATATLILAANAPDVDVLVYLFGNQYGGLAFRRGWTHGVPALVLWPVLIAGLILGWDRLVRHRRNRGALPAQAGPLLGVAALGVLTHPVLDWLNNYGMRWLMPLDGRWSYGDAIFIVDPWVWLLLGGALLLGYSRSLAALAAWFLLAAVLTVLVLGAGVVPSLAKGLWIGGLGMFAALRAAGLGRAAGASAGAPGRAEAVVRCLVLAVAAYMLTMVLADRAARVQVREAAEAAGIGPVQSVMVAPMPANPFAGHIVIVSPEAYHFGSFRWLERPRVALDANPVSRLAPPAVVAAAAAVPDARNYLVWARYPFFEVEQEPNGYRVRIGDARYERALGIGGLRGLVVELDEDLNPRPRPR